MAKTPGAGRLAHFRQAEFGVLINQIERVFVGRRLEGQHQVVARFGQLAAYDDRFRIEGVDQEGDGLARLFSDLLDQFDREIVVVLGCVDDLIDVDGFVLVVFFAQDRIDTLADKPTELLFDRDSRNFGFEATFLAAGADDFVVEEGMCPNSPAKPLLP